MKNKIKNMYSFDVQVCQATAIKQNESIIHVTELIC